MIRTSTIAVLVTATLAACQPSDSRIDGVSASAPDAAMNDENSSASPTTADTNATAAVRLSESGQYLVDASGRSVYLLQGNTGGSRCDDACEDAWPPVLAAVRQNAVASGLQPGLLSSQPRDDGTVQMTYGGHLLYRYAGDGGVGSTSGHGVRDQWGTWSLITSAGTLPESLPLPEDGADVPIAQSGNPSTTQ